MVQNMADSIKVQDFAKDLKLTAKEVIQILTDAGVNVHSASSIITADQASLVMEKCLAMYPETLDELEILRSNIKARIAEKNKSSEKPEAKPAAKPAKSETAAKTQEPAKPAKEPQKAAAKAQEPAKSKTQEPRAKAQEPAKAKTQEQKPAAEDKKPADKKPADKRNNSRNADKSTRFDRTKERPAKDKDKAKRREKHDDKKKHIVMGAANGEAIAIETDERRRYVDTRTSTVEIDKIESRERIEEWAPESRSDNRKKDRKRPQKQDRREKGKNAKQPAPKPPVKVITEVEIPETITVGDFAKMIGKSAAEVVKKLMMLGVMATITQQIDFETAELIGTDFGITVKKEIVLTKEDILFTDAAVEDAPESLVPRPPVVVVMGHVDHGKTSLLDAIRHTNVTTTEAGGITQHIGAYSVRLNERDITFLDTPGHEAFTTMRARGAQVTDVAILVVAADDGIMPQTIEAINHAKAAGVTIIVAINKIDKDGANPDRVKQMLMEYDLVPEEYGGDTVCVEVSAKKKINIDGLLEMVLLVADMQELKANPNRAATGAVIESQIDKGRGPVATVLVQNGTLKVGDVVIAGTAVGRIRAMINDKGRRVKEALPSTPVEILGLSEAPSGGDKFAVVSNEKLAREVAEQRKREQQENKFNSIVKVSLDNLFSQIDEGNMKELDVIIKADVQGSVEAVKQSLEKLSNDEVRVKAIHGGVGAINESDVMLANASNAIIVGFNVRPDAGALSAAEQQEVDIRLYRVIYQAIEEIEAAMKGMLDPEYKEVVIGHAEVRQTFKVSSVGTIAGCYVTSGVIRRNAEIRLVRNGIVIHEGAISSLRRFKDDAREVAESFECGIGIENFNDIKEGDNIECFVMEEIER